MRLESNGTEIDCDRSSTWWNPDDHDTRTRARPGKLFQNLWSPREDVGSLTQQIQKILHRQKIDGVEEAEKYAERDKVDAVAVCQADKSLRLSPRSGPLQTIEYDCDDHFLYRKAHGGANCRIARPDPGA
jgi:hypothetical protein